MAEVGSTVAIVTGGASGIGLATVRELAAAGFHTVAADRQAERLREVVERLQADGLTISGEPVDVADAQAMRQLVDGVVERYGRLDLAVACAGINDQSQITSGDPERWKDVVATNLLGVTYTARAALPPMLAQGSGHVIVVASVSGRITYVGEPVYAASKHGAVAFADCLRKEVVGQGVRVTVIEPGLVATPMLDANPFAEDLMKTVTPLHPSDCARVIRFAFEQPPHVSLNEIVIRPTAQDL